MRTKEEVYKEINHLIGGYESFAQSNAFKRMSKEHQDDIYINTFRQVNYLYKELKEIENSHS